VTSPPGLRSKVVDEFVDGGACEDRVI
jgi:hypothetical protein